MTTSMNNTFDLQFAVMSLSKQKAVVDPESMPGLWMCDEMIFSRSWTVQEH